MDTIIDTIAGTSADVPVVGTIFDLVADVLQAGTDFVRGILTDVGSSELTSSEDGGSSEE